MRINTLFSFAGFIMLIAATYCPIIRPIIGHYDVFDANKPYGIVMLLVAVVGILGTVFNQSKIIRLAAWLSLGLVVLFYLLALLKAHTSFTFIPIHSLGNYLSGKIKFLWGWYFLFGGALLAVAGVIFAKKPGFKQQ